MARGTTIPFSIEYRDKYAVVKWRDKKGVDHNKVVAYVYCGVYTMTDTSGNWMIVKGKADAVEVKPDRVTKKMKAWIR